MTTRPLSLFRVFLLFGFFSAALTFGRMSRRHGCLSESRSSPTSSRTTFRYVQLVNRSRILGKKCSVCILVFAFMRLIAWLIVAVGHMYVLCLPSSPQGYLFSLVFDSALGS